MAGENVDSLTLYRFRVQGMDERGRSVGFLGRGITYEVSDAMVAIELFREEGYFPTRVIKGKQILEPPTILRDSLD